MAEFTFEEQWSDITPIPQDDGPNPVVKIAYSAVFTKLMDLFRGVVAKREYSERVLELTEELLELNAANYTIWQYRRECLKLLKFDLNEELDYLDGFSRENPKNYQIWHHRRTIVEWLGCGERELKFCETVFDVDAKNYHAWAHRQWALKTFNLWDAELPFIEKCIKKDVRNNSAWNQGPEMVTTEVLQRELQYAWVALQDVTLNESAWNYLRGLARTHSEETRDAVKDRCREMIEQSQRQNVLAIGLLADLCEEDATALMLIEGSTAGSQAGDEASPTPGADLEQNSGDSSALQGLQALRTAEALCMQLVAQDAIRAKSWTRRVLDLRQRIAACSAALS